MTLDPARFMPANAVPDAWGLNLLLYGQPGVGKTTLAATLADVPHLERVLLVDCDQGARSICHRANVEVFTPQAWQDFSELVALADTGRWQAIIIDSLSMAYRFCMSRVLGRE